MRYGSDLFVFYDFFRRNHCKIKSSPSLFLLIIYETALTNGYKVSAQYEVEWWDDRKVA